MDHARQPEIAGFGGCHRLGRGGTVLAAVLAAVLAFLLLGNASCSRTESLQFLIKAEHGSSILEIGDRATVVFDGVDLDNGGADGPRGSGSLVVGGPGRHRIVLAVAGKELVNDYVEGKNTLTFAGHELALTERGRRLTVGGTTIDLGGARTTVTIRADGTFDVAR